MFNNKGKTVASETTVDASSDSSTSETKAQPKFTRFMVGTYIDPVTREWMLAFVQFDPVTKAVGELKTERVAGDYEVMRERLAIKEGHLGLFEPGDFTQENKLEIY